MSNFKILRNFFNFKEEQDLVSLLNESMVYFSPRFREKISKIDSPITKDLLNIEGSDIKDDISFIDFAEQEGMFTFKTMKNFKNAFDKSAEITKSWGGNSFVDDRYYQIGKDFEKTKSLVDEYFKDEHSNISQARNPFKIGRFLTAVLGSKFSNREIEDFTNKYKALQSDSAEKIIEVEGDEIAKWYDSKNYERLESTLGSSCMKYVPASYFKIYTQNPEICKMVCIISDDKLTARALLWKPVKKVKMFYTQELGFEWFMDRQYATSDAGIQKLRDYAVSKGYAYKTYNTTHNIVDVTYNGQVEKADMLVQLKNLDYSIFPYVDTLKKYDPENKTLQNDDDNSEEGYYLLISTGGGYEVTGEQDDDSYVWSEFYGEDVDRDYAVWSDIYDSYLNIDLSIQVTSGSRRWRDWYPENAEELRFDGWNDEYIHEDDAIYSEEYGHYLLEDEAISVVKEIDDSGDCQQDCYFLHKRDDIYISYKDLSNIFWFDKVVEHFDNYQSHDGVLKETLFQGPVVGEWLPKNFTVEVYSIKGQEVFREEEHLVLSRLDMEILEIEDYTTSSEMDKLSYDDYLLDFGMTDKLIKKLDSIERNTLYQMRYEQLVAIKKGEFPKY